MILIKQKDLKEATFSTVLEEKEGADQTQLSFKRLSTEEKLEKLLEARKEGPG
jgi:hypothetical protein